MPFCILLPLMASSNEEIYTCEVCTKTFPTSRGLRVHVTKVHGSTPLDTEVSPETHLRAQGIDGMPICRSCKRRFGDWYSFDRHVTRGVCKALTCPPTSAMNMATTPSSARTPVQRTEEKPLLLQHDLLTALKEDWLKQLFHKPGLRQSLKHHCCVCNQWFEKGWHLTHHGLWKHTSLFGRGKLFRNELMLRSGIAPIKWECPYCIAVFQSANIHYCPVLLQISVLVCAFEERHGSNSGDGQGQSGNDDFQGPSPLSCQHRRRCQHGARKQEKAQATSVGRRYRIRVKSRPPSASESISQGREILRETDAGDALSTKQTGTTPRGQYQHSPHGDGLYAVHGHLISWPCVNSAPTCRQVEISEVEAAHGCYQPPKADSIQVDDRRVADEGTEAVRGGPSLQADSGRGDEIWNSGSACQLSVQEMGQRERDLSPHRTAAVAERCRIGRPARTQYSSRPRPYSSLPFNTSSLSQYDSQDHSIHAGDRLAKQSCTASLGHLESVLPLWDHGLNWGEHATHQSPALPLGGRIEEDPRQDGQVTSACPTSTSSVLMTTQCLPSLIQPPSMDREQPVREAWLQMRLTNPSSVCYLNAGLSALGWGILNHADSLDTWESIGIWIREIMQIPNPKLIYAVAEGRRMMHDWPDLLRQHDVAEVLGFLLQKLDHRRATLGRWGAMHIESGWIEYTELLTHPLPIHIPNLSQCTLQHLIDLWTTAEEHKTFGILDPIPPFLLLQLVRFRVEHAGTIVKNGCHVDGLEDTVQIPVIRMGGPSRKVFFEVTCVIQHLGESPVSGHYVALLRNGQAWWRKDDAQPPVCISHLAAEHATAGYVLCLRHLVGQGSVAGASSEAPT